MLVNNKIAIFLRWSSTPKRFLLARKQRVCACFTADTIDDAESLNWSYPSHNAGPSIGVLQSQMSRCYDTRGLGYPQSQDIVLPRRRRIPKGTHPSMGHKVPAPQL